MMVVMMRDEGVRVYLEMKVLGGVMRMLGGVMRVYV